MSEGWSTAEAATRGGEKCCGCTTGRHVHDAICCSLCFQRLPAEFKTRGDSFKVRQRKARKWLRANKDGGQ